MISNQEYYYCHCLFLLFLRYKGSLEKSLLIIDQYFTAIEYQFTRNKNAIKTFSAFLVFREPYFVNLVKVNLLKKHLFLQQLNHNMTKDCSLNMKIESSDHVVNKNCSECEKKKKNNLCTQHGLSLQFSCTELII